MKTRFYQMMAVCALCLAVAALAVALWTSVLAQEGSPEAAMSIPTTLNYQGYLREPDGSLTTSTYDITAKIYNAATGGDELYSTTLSGVTVRDGLFNIVLGDEPELPSSVFANASLYIGITLNTQPELVPRQRLHAVPWAFQARTLINNAIPQTVQGLTSNGDVVVNGNTTMNSSATVGGDLTVTGNLAHPGETFVGPHFIPHIPLKYGPCTSNPFTRVDRAEIPDGATAVILQYGAWDNETGLHKILIREANGKPQYMLALFRAFGGGDDVGWGGQGVFPVAADGSFEYSLDGNGNLDFCEIYLIGYYK